MSSVPHKTDYVSEALGYLRQGFKARPNIESVVTAILSHAQELEDALQALGDGLLLKNASGAVLDNYGSLVGVSREGQTDEVYSLFILAAIAANHGDATLETTIQLAQKLFDTNTVFARHPLVLAGDNGVSGAFVGFSIGTPNLPTKLWPVAEKLLAKNVGAGVFAEPLTTFAADKAFAFASVKPNQQPYVAGWGSVKDNTQGGPYGGLLVGM